jgi:hypothetical protein
MPVPLDTEETLDIFLARDAELPAERRFAVTCRFLSCRENRRYCRLVDQRTAELRADQPNFNKAAALGWRALLTAVVQVRNGVPPSADEQAEDGTTLTADMVPPDRPSGPDIMAPQDVVDALERNLTHGELWQLAGKIPDLLGLADWDKKKLPSRWRSSSDSSAQIVPAGAAPAAAVPPAMASTPPAA